jgi:hypothetical protein
MRLAKSAKPEAANMRRILTALSFLLAFASPSFAADSTVNSLTGAGTLDGTELYYCVQSSADRKCTGAQVQALSNPGSGYVASSWYLPLAGLSSTGVQAATPAASSITCFYGAVEQKVTIGSLAVGLTTAVASGNIQSAIYTNVSSRPGTLLSSTASMSTTAPTATLTAALAANKQVGPGGADGGSGLWWCSNIDSTANAGGVKFMAPYTSNGTNAGQASLIGSTTAANIINKFSSSTGGVQCAGAACNGGSSTFGSWPASLAGSTWTDISTNNAVPLIAFQAASVP